jgi:hypothetical protein
LTQWIKELGLDALLDEKRLAAAVAQKIFLKLRLAATEEGNCCGRRARRC